MKGRGLEVLAMIYCEIEREGLPPTLREICEELEIKSTNGARHWLRQLEARGLVTRKPGISRGLRVTPAGAAEVSRYLAELADELEHAPAEESEEG